MFREYIGKVDIVSDAENIKNLCKIAYDKKSVSKYNFFLIFLPSIKCIVMKKYIYFTVLNFFINTFKNIILKYIWMNFYFLYLNIILLF